MGLSERDVVVQDIKKLFQEQKYSDVIEKINTLGETADDDYDIQTLLGAVLSKLKRGDEAVDAFRVALRLKPNSAQSFYNLAAQLYSNGRIGESKTMLDQAISIESNNKAFQDLMQKIENKTASSVPTGNQTDTTQQIPPMPNDSPDPSSFQVPGRQSQGSSAPPPSAGAYQAAAQQPAPATPGTQHPGYVPRWDGMAVKTRWTESIVSPFGSFWGWLGWLLIIGLFVMKFFAMGFSENSGSALLWLILLLAVWMVYLFWTIIDVLENEGGVFWIILLALTSLASIFLGGIIYLSFGGFIGFVVYFMKVRTF